MSAIKAKPSKPTTAQEVAQLKQHVAEQDQMLALLADTVQRISNSQVAVLSAFETLITEARKDRADGEQQQPT